MTGIRQDIGICLQHDCLFPQLTVREHIQFFARIKGMYVNMSNIEAERQVDKTLVDVALSEKRQTLSKNLSGGMKRKLSVAIAFCGGSKVVLLDEPTSGQDPFSRRFTWNVIRNYKKDRIIILTTHFMDEADILGDRIAIMAEGRLRCIGSSLFLKKTYGVGYQLTIEKYQKSARRENNEQLKRMEGEGVHSTLDVETDENLDRELKEIVKSAIQGSTVLSDAGSELSFQLPLSSSSSFAPMFADLDARVDSKAISCYGVSITTLNEVFLLVTRGVTPKHEFGPSVRSLRSNSVEGERNDIVAAQSVSDEDNHDASSDFALTHSDRLFVRHVIALMKKRGSYFRRDRKAWICTTIVPSLFVLIGFLIFAFGIPEKEMEPLTLSLLEYNPDLQKNSVSSNSPNNQFICQPGVCSHFEPLNIVNDTNEVYAYCGFESKLGVSLDGFTPSNATCSVFDSAAVISQIAANRNEAVVLDEASVQNISEVC